MNDVLARLTEADQKIDELTRTVKALEEQADDLEAQARAARAERLVRKKEREQWLAARNSLGVRKAVEDAAASAKSHEERAKSAADDLERTKAEVATELAKLKAANAEKAAVVDKVPAPEKS